MQVGGAVLLADCAAVPRPKNPPNSLPVRSSTHLGISKQRPNLVLAARLLAAQVLGGLGAQFI